MERFNELSQDQWGILFNALSAYVQSCQANEDMTRALDEPAQAREWRQWKIATSELYRELRA